MRVQPLFFFGTLMDAEVLGLVIGRPVGEAELEVARLRGFRRVRAAAASYPVLVPDPGGVVEGRLFFGASEAERARLDAYEGEAYRLAPVTVEDSAGRAVQALTYLAVPGRIAPSSEPWDLESWRARFKALYLAKGARILAAELP